MIGACNYCGVDIIDIAEPCTACGTVLRDRYLWEFVSRERLISSCRYVLHYSPPPTVAARFAAILGSNYHACVPNSAGYGKLAESIYVFDARSDTSRLSPEFYGLIIATNGLASLGSALIPALRGFKRALQPGGSLILGGDMIDEAGHLVQQAADPQPVPVRVQPLFRREFGGDCRTRAEWIGDHATLAASAIASASVNRATPDTLFWYQS